MKNILPYALSGLYVILNIFILIWAWKNSFKNLDYVGFGAEYTSKIDFIAGLFVLFFVLISIIKTVVLFSVNIRVFIDVDVCILIGSILFSMIVVYFRM